VARIRQNQVTTEFLGPVSQSWSNVITTSKDLINRAIPAVGRIELNNSDYPWAGTGWLIAPRIVVTNRHVAEVFAKTDPKTSRLVFKPGLLSGVVSVDIDFLEEENRLDSAEHPISSILWVAPSDEADVAFLQVSEASGTASLASPIELADDVEVDATIAAIGYPARDPSIRDQQLVISIFGDDVYDKKRFSPGKVMAVEGSKIKHDCSTLGGNSGSVLLDLKTGKAVGLHRAGLMDDSANLGVTAPHLRTLLAQALRSDRLRPEDSATQTSVAGMGMDQPRVTTDAPGSYRLTLHVPIDITVNVGSPVQVAVAGGVTAPGTGLGGPAAGGGADIALQEARQRFGSNPNVLKIRPGYRFKNGWITDERVIVIEVREKLDYGKILKTGTVPFPREISGVGIDVRTAALPDQLEALGVDMAILERPGRPAGYAEPPGYNHPGSATALDRVKEPMSAIFHVSPDAGFKNLKAFLQRVTGHLTATMYEWEPNHVSDAIEAAMRPAGRKLRMVTQKRGVAEADATETAVADMKQRIGNKFKHVWASVRGPLRLIPNSYHIKVASRDGEEVWLSSGNWKDSNQPAKSDECQLAAKEQSRVACHHQE
jgi:V8-like Glu-specific endopeptidase